MMRGTIVRRIITDLPISTWLSPSPTPLFQNSQQIKASRRVQISASTNVIWNRFYSRSRHQPFVKPTYNELPVPFGSWEKNFKRQNDKYNKHLAMGIGFFLFTIFVVSRVATFNFYPPPLPSSSTEDDNELCPPPTEKKCT